MGKRDIDIKVKPSNIRLENEHWATFWFSFVHVLRNAIDHGIETEEERVRTGKTGHGSIQIETYIENNEFVIALEDDGRGINWKAIEAMAVKAELPHENREDLFNSLFCDGITTKESVTQFSGRGVGMGAVQEEVKKRGGRIELKSEAGKGTRSIFRFPLNKSVYQPEGGEVANAV